MSGYDSHAGSSWRRNTVRVRIGVDGCGSDERSVGMSGYDSHAGSCWRRNTVRICIGADGDESDGRSVGMNEC
ncbi:MAG: hypothetical protein MR371_09720 [Clostridia bacterium]|nr:hypothetical protein [Clostridia bacterium]